MRIVTNKLSLRIDSCTPLPHTPTHTLIVLHSSHSTHFHVPLSPLPPSPPSYFYLDTSILHVGVSPSSVHKIKLVGTTRGLALYTRHCVELVNCMIWRKLGKQTKRNQIGLCTVSSAIADQLLKGRRRGDPRLTKPFYRWNHSFNTVFQLPQNSKCKQFRIWRQKLKKNWIILVKRGARSQNDTQIVGFFRFSRRANQSWPWKPKRSLRTSRAEISACINVLRLIARVKETDMSPISNKDLLLLTAVQRRQGTGSNP